jgi:hypothetical protein
MEGCDGAIYRTGRIVEAERFPGSARIGPNWWGFVRAFCLCNVSMGFQGPFLRLCLCLAKLRFPGNRCWWNAGQQLQAAAAEP